MFLGDTLVLGMIVSVSAGWARDCTNTCPLHRQLHRCDPTSIVSFSRERVTDHPSHASVLRFQVGFSPGGLPAACGAVFAGSGTSG